jgi:hypothetical protein
MISTFLFVLLFFNLLIVTYSSYCSRQPLNWQQVPGWLDTCWFDDPSRIRFLVNHVVDHVSLLQLATVYVDILDKQQIFITIMNTPEVKHVDCGLSSFHGYFAWTFNLVGILYFQAFMGSKWTFKVGYLYISSMCCNELEQTRKVRNGPIHWIQLWNNQFFLLVLKQVAT